MISFIRPCLAALGAPLARLAYRDLPKRRPVPLSLCSDRPVRLHGAVEAETLARALLLRLLSPVQRDQWETLGYFLVEVPERGTFCILPRPTLNVIDVIS